MSIIEQSDAMKARPVPQDLVRALQFARDVEAAAADTAQRHRAIAATTRLMLACLDAGWRVYEIAPDAGLKGPAASAPHQ